MLTFAKIKLRKRNPAGRLAIQLAGACRPTPFLVRYILFSLTAVWALAIATVAAQARGPLFEVTAIQPYAYLLSGDDTLPDLLEREQVSTAEAKAFVRAIAHRLNLQRTHEEQIVILYRSEEMVQAGELHAIAVPINNGRTIVTFRDIDAKRLRSGIYPDAAAAEWIATAYLGAPEVEVPDSGDAKVDLALQPGETLLHMLIGTGAKHLEALRATNAIAEVLDLDLHRLPADEPIEVTFIRIEDKIVLDSVLFPKRGAKTEVRRDAFGVFRPANELMAELAPDPLSEEPKEEDSEPEREIAAAEPEAESLGATPGLVDGTFGSGEILIRRLRDEGMTNHAAARAVHAFSEEMNPREIQAGKRFVHVRDGDSIRFFAVDDNEGGAILVERMRAGGFSARKIAWDGLRTETTRIAARKEAPSETTVPSSAAPVSAPPAIAPPTIALPEPAAPVLVLPKSVPEPTDPPAEIPELALPETVPAPPSPSAPQNTQVLAKTVIPVPDTRIAAVDLVHSRIERGDTLIARLRGAGGSRKDVERAITAISKVIKPDQISVGRKFVMLPSSEKGVIGGFFLETRKGRGILVLRNENDGYSATKKTLLAAEESLTRLASATIAVAHASNPEARGIRSISALPSAEQTHRLSIPVVRNDTLMNILQKAGAAPKHAAAAIQALREEFNPKKIKVGQIVHVSLGKEGNDPSDLLEGFAIQFSALLSIEAVRNGEGEEGYVVNRVERESQTAYARQKGTVKTSLYDTAVKAGLPLSVFADLIRMYSYDIDFQREIQPNDGFEVMYEVQTIDDEIVGHGRVLYASMLLGGERLPLYFYSGRSNKGGYYDDEGRTVTKPLMRTPIDGARLSSRFGMRRHPISGYSKMHRGIDFAAATGTPIYAAGDGVVERIGRYGGYGKYVRIRHNSDYKTAYAHLSRFTKGIRVGSRVTQGQVIGKVGSTGRSTGPHLHYEILFRNKRVNPLSIELPAAAQLEPEELDAFLVERNRLDLAWDEGSGGRQAAAADIR